jgi:UDP-4-amino-4,6-dideoxy-N-acetyl-beta-L-altrosamine N-acetyltransferase
MQASDLDLVLGWRNHPDVRRYMHHQRPIAPEEHLHWFSCESSNPAIHLLILEVDGVPSGYVKFTELGNGSADWGFYAAPDAPHGTGRILGDAALRHAFESLGMRDVIGHVIASNERSIAFHAKMGFIRDYCGAALNGDADPAPTVRFRLAADRWKAFNREDSSNER